MKSAVPGVGSAAEQYTVVDQTDMLRYVQIMAVYNICPRLLFFNCLVISVKRIYFFKLPSDLCYGRPM